MNMANLEEILLTISGLRVFPSGTNKKYVATYKGFYYVHHLSGNDKQIIPTGAIKFISMGNVSKRVESSSTFKNGI